MAESKKSKESNRYAEVSVGRHEAKLECYRGPQERPHQVQGEKPDDDGSVYFGRQAGEDTVRRQNPGTGRSY